MTSDSLASFVQKNLESDPVRSARHLETMETESAAEVLKTAPAGLSAEVIGHLESAYAAALLSQLPHDLLGDIIEKLDAQQGATIFLNFSNEKREFFLGRLTEKKRKEIQEILTYPEGSAGRIMTTDFLAFHGDIKVKDAIQKIRDISQRGSAASYVYVLDGERRLIGVLNMRDVVLASPDQTLDTVMRKDIFAVDSFMDREQIAREFSERHYFAVPVVDAEKKLLGVVKAEHIIEDVQEEATEDFQKMFGAGGDERVFSSILFSIKKRLPWLHVNLATAFLAASVVALFEGLIAKLTILAVFLPVVAGQGGNAGAQSLAIVMRGLVMREIPPKKVKKLIFKEMVLGAINGIVIGVVTALIASLWHGNPYLGLVVGLGMFVTLIVAGLSGAAIPIIMKAVGLDPAQCSSIILTTITDVTGFFSFLGFALLFQRYLI